MTIKQLRRLSELRNVLKNQGVNPNSEQMIKIDKVLKRYTHLFVISEEELQVVLNKFVNIHPDFIVTISHGLYGLNDRRVRVYSDKNEQYDFFTDTYNRIHDMSYLLLSDYKNSAIRLVAKYPELYDLLWNFIEEKLKEDNEIITELSPITKICKGVI